MSATQDRDDVEVALLAEIPRGGTDRDGQPREKVRVTLREFKGRAYISLRAFWRDGKGDYWPDPKKGTTVRLNEAEETADAILEGLKIASEMKAAPQPASPRRQPFQQPRRRDEPPAVSVPRASAPREVQQDAFDEFAEFRK